MTVVWLLHTLPEWQGGRCRKGSPWSSWAVNLGAHILLPVSLNLYRCHCQLYETMSTWIFAALCKMESKYLAWSIWRWETRIRVGTFSPLVLSRLARHTTSSTYSRVLMEFACIEPWFATILLTACSSAASCMYGAKDDWFYRQHLQVNRSWPCKLTLPLSQYM